MHYKNEAYSGRKYKLYEALLKSIDNYIKYYNNHHYQWKLNSLTLFKYRNQAA
ncbi:IS3 family transposase [Ligilactobacillus hayakitensis]|uniref:IS3 family transposase n=1 Tax=Ligilactobacillus hayakitensis TaxID=396716 RepID=UPI0009DCD6E0